MRGGEGPFPAVVVRPQDEPAPELPCLRLRIEDWDSPFFNFYDFDFQLDGLAAAGAFALTRAARLIAGHERPPAPGDPDAAGLALLNDADALSFFSLNSVGYLDYFGPEPTRRKVAWTLRRLRPAARRHLAGMRLVPEVRSALAELEAPEEDVA